MNPTGTFLYLAASVVLGIAQIVEAIALWKRGGRLSPMMIGFSKVEVVWAVVSLFIWREIDIAMWFPLSFTLYVAAFTVVGVLMKKQIAVSGIPRRLILPGGFFGIYFSLCAGIFLANA